MFRKIMVPVNLAHVDKLDRALAVASQLAGANGAEVVYVAVTGNTPGSVAHTPQEFASKLDAFAEAQAARGGHPGRGHVVVSHDPAVDLDRKLEEAAAEVGADLVVMQTHVPGFADLLGPHHGGALARHARISVFLVRGD